MTDSTDDEIERAMPEILAQAGEQARANRALSAEIMKNRVLDEVARAKAENIWPADARVQRFADGLLGRGVEDFRPGLFLAGADATFLRDQLAPEMARRGALAIFVDLDPAGDSYARIVDAIEPGCRTIVEAVERRAKTSGKVIFIAIANAPAAFRTESGRAAMFGLKSARDTLNIRARVLLISMSCRDRTELAPLVDGQAAPFLGATIIDAK